MEIEELKTLDKKVIKTLSSSGYTVESLSVATVKDIQAQLGMDEKLAESAIQAAQIKLGIRPISASQFLQMEKNRGKITTGSNELDSILGGGIWTQEITELAGAFSSGKTQLCFQLCVNVQLPKERGGLEAKVLFIDTERTFSPKRISEIATWQKDLEVNEVLENILISTAGNSNHLEVIIDQFEEIVSKENIKLLIIDSFASHFRSEYIGKDRLVERQQAIMHLAEKLTAIAVNYDIAVVVTNQIIASIDQFLYGNAEEPALGFAWAHRPQQRLFLRKSRGTSRIAKLFDSSRMPEKEAVFYVTAAGISDSPAKGDIYH